LRPRLGGARIATGRVIASAEPIGRQVRLGLDDGTERRVDHVLLATRYRVDVSRCAFLAPELLRALRVVNGYPVLTTGMESSVRGLHFVGAAAAGTFGPLMRFVAGTGYSSRSLTRRILDLGEIGRGGALADSTRSRCAFKIGSGRSSSRRAMSLESTRATPTSPPGLPVSA